MNIRFLSLILFLNSSWCMFAGVDFKIINNAGMLLKLSYQVACQKSDLSLGYFEYDGQPVYIEPGIFDQIAEQVIARCITLIFLKQTLVRLQLVLF